MAKQNGVRMWMIADALGIADTTFCRKLRKELSPSEKEKIFSIIDRLTLISNFVKAQQEEAARLEAYNTAVALAEAGQYDEAIAAFTELGDYKDSAEQIEQIKDSAEQERETTYNQAVTLWENGEFDEAYAAFEELGDYKDSETMRRWGSNCNNCLFAHGDAWG